MNEWVDAVFENGAFHPQVPVNLAEGQRVSLRFQTNAAADDLADVRDLLDLEFIQTCKKRFTVAPSLEEVQAILSSFQGSLADLISEERDER